MSKLENTINFCCGETCTPSCGSGASDKLINKQEPGLVLVRTATSRQQTREMLTLFSRRDSQLETETLQTPAS